MLPDGRPLCFAWRAGGEFSKRFSQLAEMRFVVGMADSQDAVGSDREFPKIFLKFGVILLPICCEQVGRAIEPFTRHAGNARGFEGFIKQCAACPLAEPDGVG